MSPGRRRPPPRSGDAGAPAAARVGLRVARTESRVTMGSLVEGMLIPVRRRAPGDAAFEIEVVEIASGHVLASRPVRGGEGDAQGLVWEMRPDLDRLDLRAFLRKWVHLRA